MRKALSMKLIQPYEAIRSGKNSSVSVISSSINYYTFNRSIPLPMKEGQPVPHLPFNTITEKQAFYYMSARACSELSDCPDDKKYSDDFANKHNFEYQPTAEWCLEQIRAMRNKVREEIIEANKRIGCKEIPNPGHS